MRTAASSNGTIVQESAEAEEVGVSDDELSGVTDEELSVAEDAGVTEEELFAVDDESASSLSAPLEESEEEQAVKASATAEKIKAKFRTISIFLFVRCLLPFFEWVQRGTCGYMLCRNLSLIYGLGEFLINEIVIEPRILCAFACRGKVQL